MDLERLKLHNALYEEGSKTHLNVATRRILAKFSPAGYHLPEIVDFATGDFFSNEIADLRAKILHTLTSVPYPVEELISRNLIFFPNEVFLRASPFHCDNWLRDSFYTALAINEPETEAHLLGNFTRRGYRHPQAPTNRLIFSDREWYFNDESTMLALIWRAKLKNMGVGLSADERCQWQDRLSWVLDHSQEGFYVTPEGTERSWFDTFNFPEPDVLSYNQGIFAACLIGTQILELRIPKRETKLAISAYNGLTNPSGRLQFSQNFPYKDTSSLMGGFLANRLFGESILPPETILRTVQTLDRGSSGYLVVSGEYGAPLDPKEFNKPYLPGDYHNSANWFFFSAVARATGEEYGLLTNKRFWENLVDTLRFTRNAEYERTTFDPIQPRYDPARTDHAWNALVYILAKERDDSLFPVRV